MILFYFLLTVAGATSLPTLHYNVSTAAIWKCLYMNPLKLRQLKEDPSLSVLSYNNHKTYVLSSTNPGHNCSKCSNMSDVLSVIDETVQQQLNKRDNILDSTDWFKVYHNGSTIYNWFEELASLYPQRVKLYNAIGYTEYGRSIMAVHVTENTSIKPKIYIQCLLHSREWITGPICMYFTQMIASVTSDSNRILARLLQEVEFIIVPIANPDGYYLTWVNYPKYRFWRKNLSQRSPTNNCVGVDLNRNFNVKWSEHGSSSNPCSDTYHGPKAQSEREVNAITHHLKDHSPILGAVDFHSFSQEVVYPYGWTAKQTDKSKLFQYFSQWVANSASQVHRRYKSKQMGSIYLASGTFGDWLTTDQFLQSNIDKSGRQYHPIPLTMELPPVANEKGSYTGFMVAPEQILPICQEILPALVKFTSLLVEQKDNWLIKNP